MLSNTFIVSEFAEILYSFPTWSCVKMCHTVSRPVPRTWQCVIWYHDQCLATGNVSYGTTTSVFHMAMCHTETRPVPFTWQCVIRYHDQRNLEICHTVPQPVCFTWQCVIRYHNECISPGNVSYGTTTSVFHLAMCHAVPQPVYFTWQCVIRYHNQCISPGNFYAIPQRCLSPSNVSYGTANSAT